MIARERRNPLTALTAAMLGLSVLFSAFPAAAQEAPPAGDAAAASAPARASSLMDAVRRAKPLLEERRKQRAEREKQPYVVSTRPAAVDIVLAVWDRDTDQISLVEAEKSGPRITVKPPSTLKIKVVFDNRVYSQYALPAEDNAIVVGVVYPAYSKITVKKKTAYEGRDVVYVPYTKEFFVPEVLAAGSDYLSYLIQEAFDELRAKGIRSRAFPDKLVVDVVDPYLIKSIVVIEHTDHASLMREDNPERTLGIFLAKLALNGNDAFDVDRSSAGAVGLVQFIPSTYSLYVKNRKDLELIPDFAKGMADHKNAVKAEVAYLDQSLAEMPAAVRAMYERDRMKAAELLAAAYNGGSTRVRRAFAAFGEDWASSYASPLASAQAEYDRLIDRGEAVKAKMKKADSKTREKLQNELAVIRKTYKPIAAKIAQYKSASLRTETVFYVVKLKKTYGMFTAGMFATPNAPSGALPVQPAAPTQPAPLALAPSNQICFGDGGCAVAQ